MAEVMENTQHCQHKFASNAKANAGLTTGIIGTSLAFNWYNKTVKKQHRENSLLQGENLIITHNEPIE